MKALMCTTDSLPQVGGVADYLNGLMCATQGSVQWKLLTTVPAQFGQAEHAAPYPVQRIALKRRVGSWLGDGFPPMRKLNTLRWYVWRKWAAQRALKTELNALNALNAGNTHKGSDAKAGAPYIIIGRYCPVGQLWCAWAQQKNHPYTLIAYGLELVEVLPGRKAKARQKAFQKAARVVSISAATTETLLGMGVLAKNIVQVCPGIWPEDLKPLNKADAEEANAQLEGLGLPKEAPFILCMGRLVARKGFTCAVEAFSALNTLEVKPGQLVAAGTHLVIAGEGPMRGALETLKASSAAGERIHLLGSVSPAQKKALYQRCLFYAMPNLPLAGDMEGFGIVFLEAGAFSKAVIGGNNGGVPSAVAPGVTGLLADTVNPGGIEGALSVRENTRRVAEAFEILLADESLRARLGRQGKQRALESFAWPVWGQTFTDMLSALGAQRPGSAINHTERVSSGG